MKAPTYTIVLPVRNGGEHLKQCVNSILAQTLTDFELVVLENCSTDGSSEWLATLQDPRIRIYPAAQPLSMMDNWARAAQVPKNEFVTFIGHDDLLDPNYLELMSALIADNPDAGLYHAHFRYIDVDGKLIKSCRPIPTHETAPEFFKAILLDERDINGTGYIMRSSDFDEYGGFPYFCKMLYSDIVLWVNLIRYSFIAVAQEECYSYRIHATSTSASSNWRDYLEAMAQFATFLASLMDQTEKEDKALEQVVRKHASTFFLGAWQSWYLCAIVDATKQNKRINPRISEDLILAFEKIAPQEAKYFKNSRSLRSRRFINNYLLTRTAYILYIRLRYGDKGLRLES